ncbi:UNVERIFIED_CONTAM: hypothetical protein NY100_05830 [Prevotella sp. 15_C9]
MNQLNKIESLLFMTGGVLMVTGAGLYAFLLWQPVACWLMLVGAIFFVLMQMRQKYSGNSITIKRLRKIMSIANIGFILAGLFMVEDSYSFIEPLFSKSIGGYTTYVNVFHHNWVVILLISAVIEVYTTHRISYELGKDSERQDEKTLKKD